MKNTFWLLTIFLLFATTMAQEKEPQTMPIVASGGSFTLEKSVTAGGAMEKQTAPMNENGTTGQAVAGVSSAGGQFSVYSGFWTPDALAPTASAAVVGGRVSTADGRGIRNARLTIVFPSGEMRVVFSGAFGYYRFTDIPVGETYVISVAAKRYAFADPTRIRQILDDVQDVDFIADPEN